MCGLFGFAGPRPADGARLTHVAALAATRGPHSHGFAFVTGSLTVTERGDGDLTNALDFLGDLMTHSIVGHSRLATTGTYAGGAPRIEDTMPFLAEAKDGETISIVHNGNVRNYLDHASRYGLHLTTGCDSEVIAHLLARLPSEMTLSSRLMVVMDKIDDGRPFVVIAMNSEGEMAALRRDLPLWLANCDEGVYLCSREPNITDATIAPVEEMVAWGWPTLTRRFHAVHP